MEPLVATLAASLLALAFWHWQHHVADPPVSISGDAWYFRRFAHTGKPVSKPYCWRPLFPILARHLGFKFVTYLSLLATSWLLFILAGGGWVGFAVAMGYMGNIHLFRFSVRLPDYADGLANMLLVAGLLAIQAGHPALLVLPALGMLCRENVGAALVVISLLHGHPVAAGLAVVAGFLAYYLRREDYENQHPLVEKTSYDTLVRWIKAKKEGALGWGHTVQPLRALPFVLPWTWLAATSAQRFDLIAGSAVLLAFALPASGQSRLVCYAYPFFVPFLAALPGPWLAFFILLQCCWPIDFQQFDEGGGITWGFTR